MHTLVLLLQERGEVTDTVAIRHLASLSISALCEGHKDNQAHFRHAEGVAALQAELQRAIAADHSLPTPYVLGVVDAVWGSVARNRKSLARFLLLGGVDSLLSLLEVCHETIQPMVLSCLADIAANPRARPFILDWESSKSQRSAVRLLLDIWRKKEGERPLVRRPGTAPDGGATLLLGSPGGPGAGTGPGAGRHSIRPHSVGVTYSLVDPKRIAVVDSFKQLTNAEATLSKAYAVLKALEFGMFTDLSPLDRATMYTVENYARLLQGEIWTSIRDRFDSEGFRATAIDRARLDGAVAQYQEVADGVLEQQAGLEEAERARRRQEEEQFYADLLAQKEAEKNARFRPTGAGGGLTLQEKIENKRRKEEMLKKSSRHVPGPSFDLSQSLGGLSVHA